MKKIMILITMLLISSALMGRNSYPERFLSSESTGMYINGIGYILPEVKIFAYANTQDTLRIQERKRDGEGEMYREQQRKERRENHGSIVNETARETPSGSGKGQTIRDVARQKRPANFGTPLNARPGYQARPLPPKGGRR